MKKVYLAGPITGTSWTESENWRTTIASMANTIPGLSDVSFFSPLRGKTYLKREAVIADSYDNHQMSTSKSIMLRDNFDVRTSDALIINFIGAKRVSIGTVMEIAWAYERRIPVICMMDDENLHNHSMINEAIWWKVKTPLEALSALELLFNP